MEGPAVVPNSLFTTSGSLVGSVDKRLVVVLRDNRKLFGILRSFDQFANLVLQDSYERIYAESCYADDPKGVYIVRGENVVLLGEVDLAEEQQTGLQQVSVKEARRKMTQQEELRRRADKARYKTLHKMGFSVDFDDNDTY